MQSQHKERGGGGGEKPSQAPREAVQTWGLRWGDFLCRKGDEEGARRENRVAAT